MDEELQPEYGPRWSDQRVERMLGALVVDGLIFIYAPSRPLAPTIVKNVDSLGSPPPNATLFAIASFLLFSAALCSLAGWAARRSMSKYGTA